MKVAKEGLTLDSIKSLEAKGYVVEVDGDINYVDVYKPKSKPDQLEYWHDKEEA